MKWVYLTIAVMLSVTAAVVFSTPQVRAQEATCYTLADVALKYEIVAEVDIPGQNATTLYFYRLGDTIYMGGLKGECVLDLVALSIDVYAEPEGAPADTEQPKRDGRGL